MNKRLQPSPRSGVLSCEESLARVGRIEAFAKTKNEYFMVGRVNLFLSVLSMLLLAGCVESQKPSTEITLATAQRFHVLLKDVGRKNGFECHMDGFPDWKLGGLEPSMGNVAEWHFTTPTDPDGDGLSDPSMVALAVSLQPSSNDAEENLLLKWESHNVNLVAKSSFNSELGSTETLIASLKSLGTKSETSDAPESDLLPFSNATSRVPPR